MKDNPILNYLSGNDNNKKEEYIGDAINAVFHYINSDEDNGMLNDLNRCFQEIVYSDSTISDYANELKKVEIELNNVPNSFNNTYFQKVEEAFEELKQTINELILKTKYISQMETVIKLYNRENERREERNEYKELDNKNEYFVIFATELEKHRRMKYDNIKQTLNLSDNELKKTIEDGKRYLNFDWNKDNSLNSISLNRKGKKYIDYQLSKNVKFSQADIDRIVEKNTRRICEASKIASQQGIVIDIKLEEISPRAGRQMNNICSQCLVEIANIYHKNTDFVYDLDLKETGKDDDTIYELSGNKRLI